MARKGRKYYGKATRARRIPGEMNKLEEAWHAVLLERLGKGDLVQVDFEPEALRVAWPSGSTRAATYTPDFRAVLSNSEVVFYEVKGFMRDDAWVKLKVAAERHPYRFCLVTRKHGEWKEEWL